MQSDVGTVTGRVGKPDGSTVAGVMVGGTAQTGAEVIKQEMAREPFRQVTVKQKEVVSILFVDAVTSADIVGSKKTQTASASAPASPPLRQSSKPKPACRKPLRAARLKSVVSTAIPPP